jgi:hypothetical protein
MAVHDHNLEEKQVAAMRHSPDGLSEEKQFSDHAAVVHEENFHTAAERGQAATDR